MTIGKPGEIARHNIKASLPSREAHNNCLLVTANACKRKSLSEVIPHVIQERIRADASPAPSRLISRQYKQRI